MKYRNGDDWIDVLPYVNNGGLWVPAKEGYVNNGGVYEEFFALKPGPWEDIILTHSYQSPGASVDPFDVLGKTEAEFDTDPFYEWDDIQAVSLGTFTPDGWSAWDVKIDSSQVQITTTGNPPTSTGTVFPNTSTDQYRWYDWLNVDSQWIDSVWGSWSTVTLDEVLFPTWYGPSNAPPSGGISMPSNTGLSEYRNPVYVYNREGIEVSYGYKSYGRPGGMGGTYSDYTGGRTYKDDVVIPRPELNQVNTYNPADHDWYGIVLKEFSPGGYDDRYITVRNYSGSGSNVWEGDPLPYSKTAPGVKPASYWGTSALPEESGVGLDVLSPSTEPSQTITPRPDEGNTIYRWEGWGTTSSEVRIGEIVSDPIDITLEDLFGIDDENEALNTVMTINSGIGNVGEKVSVYFEVDHTFLNTFNYRFEYDEARVVASKFGGNYKTINFVNMRYKADLYLKAWDPLIYKQEVTNTVYHIWNPTYEKRERDPAVNEITWHARYEQRSILQSWGPWIPEIIDTRTTNFLTTPDSGLLNVPSNTADTEYRNAFWRMRSYETDYSSWGAWGNAKSYVGVPAPANTPTTEYRSTGGDTYEKRTRTEGLIVEWDGVADKRVKLSDWSPWLDTDLRSVLGGAGTTTTSNSSTPTASITLPGNTSTVEYRNPYWASDGSTQSYTDWSSWSSHETGQRNSKQSTINVPSNTNLEEYQNPRWVYDGEGYGSWTTWSSKRTSKSYESSTPTGSPKSSWTHSDTATTQYRNHSISNSPSNVSSNYGSWGSWRSDGYYGIEWSNTKPTSTRGTPGNTNTEQYRSVGWVRRPSKDLPGRKDNWGWAIEKRTRPISSYTLQWWYNYETRSRSRVIYYKVLVDKRTRTQTTTYHWYAKGDKRTEIAGNSDEIFRIKGRRRLRP